jgi:acetyl esterase/lipase/lysophospholipase L1-like esterase
MKTVFVLIALLIIDWAQAQQVIPLYNGKAPGNVSDIDHERSVTPEKGRPSVINVSHPALIAYLPKVPNAARPAVIICPGGGYVRLTIEDGGYEVARSLADSGVAAFVLKYRTWQDSAYTNYRNLPFNDLEQALALVYSRAGEWNIDTTKIGLLGFSAGGHLAAMGATSTTGKKTAFTILAYPVISFTDTLVSPTLKSRSSLLGKKITEEDKIQYSPELQVSAATPPAFLVHAQDDSTSWVGNSIAYYKALTAKKITGELMIYPKGGHGFAMYNKAMGESWMPQAMKWLRLNGFYTPAAPKLKQAEAPPLYNEILAFKKQDAVAPPAPGGILFVGSSSFRKWTDVKDYFPGYPIINRGFGGSVLTDVIRYSYDIILPYKPKQVLVYCGENDLASGDSITAAVVVQRFKTLFGIIRQNLPNTVISFVSIKPSPVRARFQDKVKEANKQIQAWIKTQPRAQFIDIYDSMLDSKKQMREELYLPDRLHMKPEGYAIWKKMITPYLIK